MHAEGVCIFLQLHEGMEVTIITDGLPVLGEQTEQVVLQQWTVWWQPCTQVLFCGISPIPCQRGSPEDM